MKGKIIRGANPRGLFHYLIGTDKTKKNMQGRVIGGNMAPRGVRPDANNLTNLFIKAGRSRKKPAKFPVVHIPLRMPKGEDVSDDKWLEIAKALMVEMKLTPDRPWILVKHPDEHVHLVTSAINYKGDLWHGHFEVFNLITATNKLEHKFELTITPTLKEADKNRILLSSGQRQKKTRQLAAGIEPPLTPNEKLAELIRAAILESNGEFEAFKRRLESKQVEVLQSKYKPGDVYGISFKFEGAKITGSKIARGYSWKGITDLLETQKAACIIEQQARDLVSNTELSAAAAEPISANPVAEIAPAVIILPPVSVQTPPAAPADIVTARHEIIISEPPPVPTSPVVAPPAPAAPAILTLDQTDKKLWQPDEKSWGAVQKTLVNRFRLDPIWINELHKRSLLWAVDKNTLATPRRSLVTGKMLGATVLPLNSDQLIPNIFAPDQPGFFFGFGKFADAKRVVVTANATEVLSYYHLTLSGNNHAPPGWVVSVDAQLPPAWLVDAIIKSKKRLLLATKTELSDREIAKALPQLVVPGTDKFHDWFERDSSLAKSWNALLIEQLKIPGQIKTKGMPR